MDLKKSNDSDLDIVVRKTTILINSTAANPSARVLVWNKPDRVMSVVPFSSSQLVIDRPGEYEVEDVTISAWESFTKKGDEPASASGLYVSVQNLDYSVLVIPALVAVPDKAVEQFGFAEVICVPYEVHTPETLKILTKILKDFSDARSLVLISEVAIDAKQLEEISSAVHPPVSVIKLKDLLQDQSDTTAIHCLIA